ncbi:MAG TPA: ABC transporter permease [Streptosporangiaceae bacterium]|jgi:peptide/nickel transport system permease protein
MRASNTESLAAEQLAADGGEVHGDVQRWLGIREFLGNGQARTGIAIVVVMFLFCFLGPVFYHTNETAVNLMMKDLPPSSKHLLGTDDYGFDVIGRLMRGGQASFGLGFAVAGITTVVGTLYGAVAGIVGGIIDGFMMRIIDTLLAIPGIVLLLIMVNIFTPTLVTVIFVLSVLSWLGVARLVRGEVLSLRTRDYVLAARTMGSRTGRIMWRHMVPNALGVIIVNATFSIADAITALSTLSFLGLGMAAPYADWGTMLSNGLNDLFDGYWWLIYPPAILLILTIIGFSLIGDAVRDSLDVRLRRR